MLLEKLKYPKVNLSIANEHGLSEKEYLLRKQENIDFAKGILHFLKLFSEKHNAFQ